MQFVCYIHFDVKCRWNNTPLDDATNHGHQQVADLLKEHLNEYDLANEIKEEAAEEEQHDDNGGTTQEGKYAQSVLESANHPSSEIRQYC